MTDRPVPRIFDVHDLLPFVEVAAGERPIVLEQLDVSVRVSGVLAETTQTMVFRNPNRRALEGQLRFPLPDHGVVCGYAIDVDGELVEGVVVPKQEARRILEAEIRKGVDPGLVEQVQGNLYRTRIYPLPPGGTRTVRITYVSELIVDGTSAGYHLPLGHAKAIERVTLRVEVAQGEVAPEITGGVGNLTLTRMRAAFVAEATVPRGAAADDLVVRLPDLPRHLRAVERSGDETFFAVSSAVPVAAATWRPRRLALVWDASGSRTDVARDLALIAALWDAWPGLVVDVRVVRDVVDDAPAGVGDDRDRLLAFLRDQPCDGGTDLAGLDLTTPPHPDDEGWLLFSDGLDTVGRGAPRTGGLPVIAVSSAPASDGAYLRHVADQSGGLHVDLLRTGAAAAVELIGRARAPLRVAATEGCADLHVRRAAGRLSIVGRLTADVGQVRLAGDGAPDDHLSITRAMAVDGHLVARAWAGEQTRALAVTEPDAPAILELARRHGVVTAGASLLVLDTLEQHLEYGVAPATSRKELRRQYVAARERTRRDERATKASHLEQVILQWNARVRWWETDWRPAPVVDKKKRAMRPSPDLERPRATEGAPMMDAMMAEESAAPPPPAPAAPSAMMAGGPPMASMAAGAVAAGAPAVEDEAEDGPDAPPRASIQIKPWSADTPYLTRLRASDDPYATYLGERADHGASPAFFLDCGDFFLGRGLRALGLRVFSNLLELGLDDPALLRMVGWRLQAAGELDRAIAIFERVRRLRADEPQSHRDLALALAERWEAGLADASGPARVDANTDVVRAMDLLYDVIERGWERFPEIELIALMELNRLIARAGARGVARPERIDQRLVRLLDLDLRISMSWDLDMTDVDLHVFEPDGEHAYYGHNRTPGGGLVSLDFRQGYGPEEYVRRRAQPGVYTVKAHYYGSHQQDIAGACTVIVHVTTNFARADEQRQVLTLRLDRPSDQVVVGEVTFAGAPPPADWRPRFAGLRRGMSIDQITATVGQPTRIEGAAETILVYELGPDLVHVVTAPRLTAVRQLVDGAVLDLL
jgi:Ca-activated chloride channel family protein